MYENLIHLVMSADVKKENCIFSFFIYHTNIGGNRKSTLTNKLSSQLMVIQGIITFSCHELCVALIVLPTKFYVWQNSLCIMLFELFMKPYWFVHNECR